MSNKEAKRWILLVGMGLLAWASIPRALAQSANPSLYDQFGNRVAQPAPAAKPAVPAKPTIKSKFAKNAVRKPNKKLNTNAIGKKASAKKVATTKKAATNRLAKNNTRIAKALAPNGLPRSQQPQMRRTRPVATNMRNEINGEVAAMQADLTPMNEKQIRDRQRARQLQKLAQSGAIVPAPLGPDDDQEGGVRTGSQIRNSSRVKLAPVEDTNKSEFGGTVNFLIGHDDNIDPNKSGVKGTFYQIDPTLTFKSGNFDGKVGAMIKDFSDQEISDTNKQTEATAAVNYNASFTKEFKSTTTVEGVYHDEKWPNYIDGLDVNDVDHGMPVRYTDAKVTETLKYDFGNGFTTEVGGYAEHQEASNLYTDWAPDALGQLRFKPSFNQYSAFAKFGIQAGDYVEFALRPAIIDKKYTEREARQADGTPGGVTIEAPLMEIQDTELNFDVNFKFGSTTITPTVVVGQQADPVYGALDGNYVGAGLTGKIEIPFYWHITLAPSVIYKMTKYDNWTYETENPDELRVDNDLTAGISATMMVTKNFGVLANYSKTHNLSTYTDPSEGYNEEVISSGIMFTF